MFPTLKPADGPARVSEAMETPIAFDRIRLVLFDLDGTLVDSVPDLAWSGNRMLSMLGLPERDPVLARAWVGNGIERFVKRFLTGELEAEPDPAQFERGLEIFRQAYADHVSDLSEIYPGVVETLEYLHQTPRHVACVTNKAGSFTHDLLAALDLDRYFELVVAGDTTARKKPDPMPLEYAAGHFGLDCADCLMIGDSSNDVRAARAAGFAVVCVPYGYNHGVDIRESQPDLVVDDLRELIARFS